MKRSESLSQAKNFLTNNGFSGPVEAAIILGSGLSGFTESLNNAIEIPYSDIPTFPLTSVEGHKGSLMFGAVGGKEVIVFSGRFHHYEGFPFSTTVLPVHIAKIFDAQKIIISNAAGAVNESFKVGDLMVIEDIFRLFHSISSEPSKRFKFNLYPFAGKTRKIATEIGLETQRGTYLYVKGPNYETKAEIRAFQRLGVDVVGMSTAPELAEASRLNMPAVGISLVTNMAAGLASGKLNHDEVKEAADTRKEDFAKLVTELIVQL